MGVVRKSHGTVMAYDPGSRWAARAWALVAYLAVLAVVHDQEAEGERSAVGICHPDHVRAGARHRSGGEVRRRQGLEPNGEDHDASHDG